MFSQTVEYALRAVMFLAANADRPASSERISDEMQIPRAYLSKILRGLVLARVVDSLMGPNGGFVMAKPITKVTVLDVVNAVDPIKRITECPLGRPDHVRLCPLHRQMDSAIEIVEKTLRNVTIAELQQEDDAVGKQALVQVGTPSKPPPKTRTRKT